MRTPDTVGQGLFRRLATRIGVSDSALQHRLDRIERRQRYVLALLVYPYLVGVLWAVSGRFDDWTLFLAAVAAVALVLAGYLRALYRGRTTTASG